MVDFEKIKLLRLSCVQQALENINDKFSDFVRITTHGEYIYRGEICNLDGDILTIRTFEHKSGGFTFININLSSIREVTIYSNKCEFINEAKGNDR